jgi:ribosomal protein L14E/L6E/L27E
MKKKRQTDQMSLGSPDYQDERVGDIAVSTAGHDAGLLLVVVAGIDDKYVLVADGKNRKLIAPKKKKMQHISILTKLNAEDTEKLNKREVNDSLLRKKLSALDLESFT